MKRIAQCILLAAALLLAPAAFAQGVVVDGDPAPVATVVASAVSQAFFLDTREGPRESEGSETLTWSSIWNGDPDGTATVTILQSGAAMPDATVAEGLSGESNVVWSVDGDGTYVLTHSTMTGGGPIATETATFVVRRPATTVDAALAWKYAKNANGWHCAQLSFTWHPSYGTAISDMRLLFADRYEGSEPLAVIKALDEEQAAFFEVPGMIKMAGNDWKYYFLNDENGKVYSERFLESGYREKLDERPTVSDGDEAGTLTSWGGSDDRTRYITNGVLNADGTSFSDDITVNGRKVTLKFASSPRGLGRRTAYLVDPAAALDPLGTTETYRDVEYRAVPVDLAAFAGLADGERAVCGVSDETMASSLDSVPAEERKICLRVANRDLSTVAPMAGGKLAVLAWKSNGRDVYLPVGEPVQPKPKAATFTVRFLANGGTGTMSALTAAAGSAAVLPANAFARKGWVFLGWALRPDGPVAYKNGASAKDLAAAGKTATLYAKWAKKAYKVKFFANDGTDRTAVQKMTWGKKAKLKANAFKRKGYVFKGWAKSKAAAKKGEVAYKNGKTVKNLVADGKTVKLFAVWKKAQ